MGTKENGTTTKERKPRAVKPATARSVGVKISSLLETLPAEERTRALEISRVLTSTT